MTATTTSLSPGSLLSELLATDVLRQDDWDKLLADKRDMLARSPNLAELLTELVSNRLLTDYQAGRISIGKSSELVLGNYRILDVLGSGSMGVVLKGEHRYLHRLVAIKVVKPNSLLETLKRFSAEIRPLGELHHPNIVTAFDAGYITGDDPAERKAYYLVAEFVPGEDLQALVQARGPLPIEKACDLIYQIASALAEVHKQDRVHREVKPSNIRVTPEGKAKLLDFGVTRDFHSPVTQMHSLAGSLEHVAAEQTIDAQHMDIRADIFGLGAVLFWCLTARAPFSLPEDLAQACLVRQTHPPPSARFWRSDVPESLDSLLMRMLAIDPNGRPATPEAVMRALLPFLPAQELEANFFHTPQLLSGELGDADSEGARSPHLLRVLIVDDEPSNRHLCRQVLERENLQCDEASDGLEALELIQSHSYDLILLDIDMPRMKGTEVLRRLREHPPSAHLKIMMLSGRSSGDELAHMLAAGANDYLTKPFTLVQMASRAKAALQLKVAQDRSDRLGRKLLTINLALEQNLHARDIDLVQARNALVLSLAELVAHRDTETGSHLLRLQHYSRRLAEEAMILPEFADQIDLNFIHMLESCAPLHDIGKAGIPDAVLLKPGRLDPTEWAIMETHTTIGAAVLTKAAKQHPSAVVFFHMAVEIARHHHERYDGAGYPDRLAGTTIPLSARILALADVYDALRTRRSYKSAQSHEQTMETMSGMNNGHFDPHLFQAFLRCAPHMEQIYAHHANEDLS